MSKYWLKLIYGPAGAKGYPKDLIHFAENQEELAHNFCSGTNFLLYETGNNGGSKKIYGHGRLVENKVLKVNPPRISNDKKFPYAVKIELLNSVHPKDGIDLNAVRKVLGRTNIQSPGGLISLSESQYQELLDKLLQIISTI